MFNKKNDSADLVKKAITAYVAYKAAKLVVGKSGGKIIDEAVTMALKEEAARRIARGLYTSIF